MRLMTLLAFVSAFLIGCASSPEKIAEQFNPLAVYKIPPEGWKVHDALAVGSNGVWRTGPMIFPGGGYVVFDYGAID